MDAYDDSGVVDGRNHLLAKKQTKQLTTPANHAQSCIIFLNH